MQENPADTPKAIREQNLNYKSHENLKCPAHTYKCSDI